MILFNKDKCIDICLKNTNKYVLLAVEDMQKDFERRSKYSLKPQIINEESDYCIVIEENKHKSSEPIIDEGFLIKSEAGKIRIIADGYLGTMWGIYTFCEQYLGIDPCYLFNDFEIKKVEAIEVDDIYIDDKPKSFGFRGVFINDEDFLTDWKEGGGPRYMDYPYYNHTVAPSVMDMVVETVLRNKMNLVIPASFLDIDNPPEKMLADCVARRGIYLSQHHLEPLGVSHFTLENYCKKHNKSGEYSYIQYPELLEEAWRYYVRKWAEYDNVVWQIGLRGKADRPVWEEDIPTDEELRSYADFISNAMKRQRQIAIEETGGKAHHFTSTLWMEGSLLMEKGYLDIEEGVCAVFSDIGPNQMFGNEYHSTPRENKLKYGIYYHLQYFGMGPHLAPQTGLNKLYYNIQKAYQKGDNSYLILNVSNVREFTFEIGACAKLLWDINGYSKDDYISEYCNKMYAEKADEAKRLINEYFDQMPQLDNKYLCNVHAKYFNYFYDEVSPGVKNFVLKDGLILGRGRIIIGCFLEPLNDSFLDEMYEEIKRVEPIYTKLSEDFEKMCVSSDGGIKLHNRVKWKLHCDTLRSIYNWYVNLYQAKKHYDANNMEETEHSVKEAIKIMEEYLRMRKCAEYGDFENWYRGDIKLNMNDVLYQTRRILERI